MTAQTIDDEIRGYATALRLGSHVVPAYKEMRDVTSPALFVRDLLKRLCENRNEERVKRNRQASGIPNLDKTLEVYEREGVTMPTGLTFDALASCGFIEKRQNLVMMGVPGSGKTHLASALGIKACDLGYKVMFRRMANLIEELQTAHDNHAWPRYRRRIEQCDLLIIDEWGYLPTNVDGTRLLFEVIADCYEQRSIIVTTNLPFVEWNRIFSDERLLLAIMDRIVHHGYLLKHADQSYRLRHSLMK